MRIVLVHPNYHSGGAEIAGNWPPAWAVYLAGSLKSAGFDDVHFIDAMTNDLPDEVLREKLQQLAPDVVGVTAITPSIYMAERVLNWWMGTLFAVSGPLISQTRPGRHEVSPNFL